MSPNQDATRVRTNMPEALIETAGLVKEYLVGEQTVAALRGVSVSIQNGEFVAVMGPSGSGKSTFMNLIGCLDSPTRGDYMLAGERISALSGDALAAIRNKRIGFVFQQFNLLPRTNALDNVELPLLYAGVPAAERHRRAKRRLVEVGLADRMHHHPAQLSGGQQQRVAIARALVNDPSILLADEPTGNLDERATRGVFQLLREINAGGTVVVMATHDLDLVRQTNYRTIELREGTIAYDSAVDDSRATGTR